ncbi:MAG: hypothetical protein WEB87_05725 [Bacteriovoracaceae bacterium]
MEDKTIIENRLIKNHKKLKKWLLQNDVEAYRLYDKDIPQYPYIIDIYKNTYKDSANVHVKKREKKKGKDQYGASKTAAQTKIVKENNCQYLINLNEYLDSGLFLDHRPLRRLKKNGILFFSTNLRKFKLDPVLSQEA